MYASINLTLFLSDIVFTKLCYFGNLIVVEREVFVFLFCFVF